MFNKTIRICISYHQKLVADGMASILSRNKKMIVSKLCMNKLEDLKKEISIHKPQILIFEAEYISPHFIELLEKTRQSYPQLQLLVVSGMVSHELLNELLLIINGYLLRTCEAEKLLFAVQEITETGKFLCPQLINTLLDKKDGETPVKNILTSREKEILLQWFHLGRIFKIAEKLHISETTVRTHLKNIRDKLGKPSSAKLIFYACQENHANGNTNPVCPYCKSVCTVYSHNDVNPPNEFSSGFDIN